MWGFTWIYIDLLLSKPSVSGLQILRKARLLAPWYQLLMLRLSVAAVGPHGLPSIDLKFDESLIFIISLSFRNLYIIIYRSFLLVANHDNIRSVDVCISTRLFKTNTSFEWTWKTSSYHHLALLVWILSPKMPGPFCGLACQPSKFQHCFIENIEIVSLNSFVFSGRASHQQPRSALSVLSPCRPMPPLGLYTGLSIYLATWSTWPFLHSNDFCGPQNGANATCWQANQRMQLIAATFLLK